jgi:hypothetical protein
MDTWHPFQTHRGFMVLVKHIDLSKIPDPKKRAAKVDNVSDLKLPDLLLGKRGIQSIFRHFKHLL